MGRSPAMRSVRLAILAISSKISAFSTEAAPGKGAVALHQHTGERPRVQAATAELLHDHPTSIGLIRRVDLILRQTTGTGYVAVGKIRVGSAVGRYVPPGLRPRTGPGRMGVGNAPDLRERLI